MTLLSIIIGVLWFGDTDPNFSFRCRIEFTEYRTLLNIQDQVNFRSKQGKVFSYVNCVDLHPSVCCFTESLL